MLALVSIESVRENIVEDGAHHADVVEAVRAILEEVRPSISAGPCAEAIAWSWSPLSCRRAGVHPAFRERADIPRR